MNYFVLLYFSQKHILVLKKKLHPSLQFRSTFPIPVKVETKSNEPRQCDYSCGESEITSSIHRLNLEEGVTVTSVREEPSELNSSGLNSSILSGGSTKTINTINTLQEFCVSNGYSVAAYTSVLDQKGIFKARFLIIFVF